MTPEASALTPLDIETSSLDRVQGFLQEDLLQGPLRVLDSEGSAVSEATYRAGQLDGECRYYANGQVIAVQNYQAGRLHGPSTSFEPSGEPSSELHYVDGKLDGPARWFMSGALIREGGFEAGRASGEWRCYGADGALFESVNYQQGVAHGVARRYAADGAVLAQRCYEQGRPTQPWTDVAAQVSSVAERSGSRLERWIRG